MATSGIRWDAKLESSRRPGDRAQRREQLAWGFSSDRHRSAGLSPRAWQALRRDARSGPTRTTIDVLVRNVRQAPIREGMCTARIRSCLMAANACRSVQKLFCLWASSLRVRMCWDWRLRLRASRRRSPPGWSLRLCGSGVQKNEIPETENIFVEDFVQRHEQHHAALDGASDAGQGYGPAGRHCTRGNADCAPIVGWVANHSGPRWALGVGAGAGFAAALVAVFVLSVGENHVRLTVVNELTDDEIRTLASRFSSL